MNKKKDLYEELNIKRVNSPSQSPFDVDIRKIKNKVNQSIDSANSERKSSFMKSKKKFVLIALAATLVLGVTGLAASNMVTLWSSSSSGEPEYKTLPTSQQCIEDVGYAPVLIEAFENGYEFDNGSVVNNNLSNESGDSVEKFKSFTFRYEKEGDDLIYSQEKFHTEIEPAGDVAATESGIEIYYNSYRNKNVPPDYVMTDEDKKAEESGELIFSWGSSEVEIVVVQSVYWVQGDLHHTLMQIDGSLSGAELVEMAKEIINK